MEESKIGSLSQYIAIFRIPVYHKIVFTTEMACFFLLSGGRSHRSIKDVVIIQISSLLYCMANRRNDDDGDDVGDNNDDDNNDYDDDDEDDNDDDEEMMRNTMSRTINYDKV